MLYICKRCNFSCIQKNDMRRHLSRKNPCKTLFLNISRDTLIEELEDKGVQNEVKGVQYGQNGVEAVQNGVSGISNNNISTLEVNNSNIKCPKCGKEFKSKKYLTQHINRYGCKEKLKQEETDLIKQIRAEKDEEMAQKEAEYKEEMALMRKQIELLMTKIGNTNIETQNNTNINSNNTNNITNIQINGWGEEDRTHLSDKFYRFCYDRPFTSIQRVIEAVFFNANCPKNWNCMIKDDKSSKALIYDREKDAWLKKETTGILEDLVHNRI